MESVLHRGHGRRPEVALTYDDGPGQATPAILDLLAAHDARATFFMDGRQAEGNPDLAQAVVDAGHEVGSHAMNHTAAPDAALADMLLGAEALERVVGFMPQLYRAPYGYFVPEAVAEADQRGWKCIAWSAEGRDWEDAETAQSVADRIRPLLVPGAIVLLHDARRDKDMDADRVIGATELILDELARRELRPRTVSGILS